MEPMKIDDQTTNQVPSLHFMHNMDFAGLFIYSIDAKQNSCHTVSTFPPIFQDEERGGLSRLCFFNRG